MEQLTDSSRQVSATADQIASAAGNLADLAGNLESNRHRSQGQVLNGRKRMLALVAPAPPIRRSPGGGDVGGVGAVDGGAGVAVDVASTSSLTSAAQDRVSNVARAVTLHLEDWLSERRSS